MMRKFIPVSEVAAEWRKDPAFVAAYDALEEEFALASALIDARAKANMTQEQVAERMKTSQSYVAKLEGSRVSPTLKALKRYAEATGSTLKISFVPRNQA
jgi:ribosome-binding protein aMBF1 (putative translation factor)